MSCRTTFAGSAFTTFARLASGGVMSDVATLSAFHALRRDWSDNRRHYPWLAQQVSPENYQRLVAGLRERIETNTLGLTEARRASLLARLDSALTQTPDEATIYALNNIVSTSETQSRGLNRFLSEYSRQTGVSMNDAEQRFHALEEEIARGRSSDAPDTYTDDNRTAADRADLGSERGSVHAFSIMRAEGLAVERQTLSAQPRRITRTPITTEPYNGFQVLETGYDPRNGRIEVVVRAPDGTVTEHAYRNVDRNMINMLVDPAGRGVNATQTWSTLLRGRTWNHYESDSAALRDSVAPRCAVCGQFADTSHSCPTTVGGQVRTFNFRGYETRTSGQAITGTLRNTNGEETEVNTRVDLPLVNDLRTAGREGTILLENVTAYMGGYYYGSGRNVVSGRLNGDLAIVRDPETGEITYNTRELKCDCPVYARNYHCEHVDLYVAAVRTRLNPPARTPAAALTPEQREERLAAAQQRAEQAAATDWTRNEESLAEARRTWAANAEVSYSQDYERFSEDLAQITEAMAAKNGSNAVPFMRDNVLGGMAQRGSGQAFGMEIEYEFPNTMSYAEQQAANQRIGQALHDAGLTPTTAQVGYHSATQAGFRDYHTDADGKGTWSWERDGSVSGGELVTPAMYDEPETWTKLEQAVKILRDNGAVATTKAGAHVHVGTGMYQGDVTKYGELAQLMIQHEDVLFRLAQNPERGSHRQGHYTLPLRKAPAGGWADISAIKSWQSGRTRALNFGHVSGGAGDHPEFRLFDSTLDAGVMQTQIKMAVAMTHAAGRIAADAPTTRNKETIGSHAERAKIRGRRRPTAEDVKEETATFRSFVDTLFTREADKKQMLALFAATKWNKPDSANKRMIEQEARTTR